MMAAENSESLWSFVRRRMRRRMEFSYLSEGKLGYHLRGEYSCENFLMVIILRREYSCKNFRLVNFLRGEYSFENFRLVTIYGVNIHVKTFRWLIF